MRRIFEHHMQKSDANFTPKVVFAILEDFEVTLEQFF